VVGPARYDQGVSGMWVERRDGEIFLADGKCMVGVLNTYKRAEIHRKDGTPATAEWLITYAAGTTFFTVGPTMFHISGYTPLLALPAAIETVN
jgi:hypothetical protein